MKSSTQLCNPSLGNGKSIIANYLFNYAIDLKDLLKVYCKALRLLSSLLILTAFCFYAKQAFCINLKAWAKCVYTFIGAWVLCRLHNHHMYIDWKYHAMHNLFNLELCHVAVNKEKYLKQNGRNKCQNDSINLLWYFISKIDQFYFKFLTAI